MLCHHTCVNDGLCYEYPSQLCMNVDADGIRFHPKHSMLREVTP